MAANKDHVKDCKPQLKYVHPKLIEGVAFVMMAGAEKYGEFNYLKGHRYTDLLDACQRHLNALRLGENYDLDTSKRLEKKWKHSAPLVHHLYSAVANLNMLVAQIEAATIIDDRESIRVPPKDKLTDEDIKDICNAVQEALNSPNLRAVEDEE